MKLLLPYLMVVFGLFLDYKKLQYFTAFCSIIVFFIIISHFSIGGDYKSLQMRADDIGSTELIWSTDLTFQVLVRISNYIGVEVPILYSLLILFFLPLNFEKPIIFVFSLVIGYYLLVTGFQRQALSALIVMQCVSSNSKIFKLAGILTSMLTHKSVILLIALRFLFLKNRSIYFSFITGIVLFLAITSIGNALKGTFIGHYIQYYFQDQMSSEGAIFRLLAIILVYIILVFKNAVSRDYIASIFESLTVYAGCVIIYGSTTAGDRILIFSCATLLFSGLVTKASQLRLIFASAPFVTMTVLWVFMSKQALYHW